MNCERAREILPELLDQRTPPTSHLEARAHLAGCPDCQRDCATLAQVATALDTPASVAPSARLRTNFYSMLEEEKHSAASARAVSDREQHSRVSRLWRWVIAPLAGGALAAVGFIAGMRYSPLPAIPSVTANSETRQKLADLQQKVDTMSQLVGYSLLQQQQQRPTNDRLRGVFASATIGRPENQVINELICALALDPSAHVRLCALEGLYPHREQEAVRAGVLTCLTREENPLVQISMIDLLATARDAGARAAIERIALSDRSDRTVRDAAQHALTQF